MILRSFSFTGPPPTNHSQHLFRLKYTFHILKHLSENNDFFVSSFLCKCILCSGFKNFLNCLKNKLTNFLTLSKFQCFHPRLLFKMYIDVLKTGTWQQIYKRKSIRLNNIKKFYFLIFFFDNSFLKVKSVLRKCLKALLETELGEQ